MFTCLPSFCSFGTVRCNASPGPNPWPTFFAHAKGRPQVTQVFLEGVAFGGPWIRPWRPASSEFCPRFGHGRGSHPRRNIHVLQKLEHKLVEKLWRLNAAHVPAVLNDAEPHVPLNLRESLGGTKECDLVTHDHEPLLHDRALDVLTHQLEERLVQFHPFQVLSCVSFLLWRRKIQRLNRWFRRGSTMNEKIQ